MITGALRLFASLISTDQSGIGKVSEAVNEDVLNWKDIVDGSGDYEANLLFTAKKTDLADTTTESYDLEGGNLSNRAGQVTDFKKVSVILLKAHETNAGPIEIDGGSADSFKPFLTGTAPKLSVEPGGVFLFAETKTGLTVSPTADLLKIKNTSGDIAGYDLVLVGKDA